MNKLLSALITKLNWQLYETQQQLQKIVEKNQEIHHQIKIKQHQTEAAYFHRMTTPIQLEQEIVRQNFIMRNQQQSQHLILEKNKGETEQLRYQEQLIHLKSELKMLEQYQKKQCKIKNIRRLNTK